MTAATNVSYHGSHSHREPVENLDQSQSDLFSRRLRRGAAMPADAVSELLPRPAARSIGNAGGLELLLELSELALERAQLRCLRVQLVVGDGVVHLLCAGRRTGEATRAGSRGVHTRLDRRRRTRLEAAQGFVAAERALDGGDALVKFSRVIEQLDVGGGLRDGS